MQRLLVFDDGKGTLAPLCDLRAAFDIRTGALTTLQRVTRLLRQQPCALSVPSALTAIVRSSHAFPVSAPLPASGSILLYNGRCPLPPAGLADLQPGQAFIEAGSRDIIAACVNAPHAPAILRGELPAEVRAVELPAPALLSRPWHVRTFRDRALEVDLRLLTTTEEGSHHPEQSTEELFEHPSEAVSSGFPDTIGPLRIPGFPIAIASTARIYPGTILDAEHGPIVIDQRAVIRPGAILIGPVYIGPCATILERATIRPGTAIGPWCKINGEVGGCLFQGYANKAHDGYLGDSWVGEWVNLGAGTTGSNLLNTYSEIPAMATPGSSFERSGETFLGSIIGDHVKTAISTRLMTGTVLHLGGMFATTAPVSGCSRPFCWRTDAGERSYKLDKFIDVARAMMARRKIEPSAAYLDRLRTLHAAANP